MTPPEIESEVVEALEALGTGLFPDVWKSTILRAAAVVQRFCAPGSVYIEEARQIVSNLNSIGENGTLQPGWDSPKGNMAAVLNAVLQDAKTGSLWRGLWEAKNDTCTDILQQADALLLTRYFAAAAVLAGGALEAHLKDLCERHELNWQGDGSITKYQGALSAAQNRGDISFFSTGDGKFVTAWGDLRNRAAHTPASILAGDDVAISNMLLGIRDFIKRVP